MGSKKYSFPNAKKVQIIEENYGQVTQGNTPPEIERDEDIIITILNAKTPEFEKLFSKADKQYSEMDENEARERIQFYVDQEIDTEEKKNSFLEKVAKSVYNIATSFVGAILYDMAKMKAFGI